MDPQAYRDRLLGLERMYAGVLSESKDRTGIRDGTLSTSANNDNGIPRAPLCAHLLGMTLAVCVYISQAASCLFEQHDTCY